MARRVLLDTGFVVALVNRRDADHLACAAVWEELRAQILSVEGVLVESAHLLRRAPGGVEAMVRLIFESGCEVVPLSSERTERATTLTRKYQDLPMDFVDAQLVALAEERGVREVLTLDRSGFTTYRIRGRGKFSILP